MHPRWRHYGDLSSTKLLKLACLYDLFTVPDCAAELLVARRAELTTLIDVRELLEALTPRLNGRHVGYEEYTSAFSANPSAFYPTQPAPTLVQRAKHQVARIIGRV